MRSRSNQRGFGIEIMWFCVKCDEEMANAGPAGNYVCRKCRYLSRYGISQNTYKWLAKRQQGACAICGCVPSGTYPDILCVDHDHAVYHETHIRGLLCRQCNSGLGQFRDNITLLRKAILYLRNGTKEVGNKRRTRRNRAMYISSLMSDPGINGTYRDSRYRIYNKDGWNVNRILLIDDETCEKILKLLSYYVLNHENMEPEVKVFAQSGVVQIMQGFGVERSEIAGILEDPRLKEYAESLPQKIGFMEWR
jgi:Recombination endonuclease VII